MRYKASPEAPPLPSLDTKSTCARFHFRSRSQADHAAHADAVAAVKNTVRAPPHPRAGSGQRSRVWNSRVVRRRCIRRVTAQGLVPNGRN